MLCDKKDATPAASSVDMQVAFNRKIQQALVRREECSDYRK
jgi:hypothetical protein